MQVINYRAVNKGNLLGFLNLKVEKWGITIYDIGVFQKNGRRWVNLPARAYEKDGEKKFFAYIHFDTKELKDAFSDKALEALDEYAKSNPEPQQEFGSSEVPF